MQKNLIFLLSYNLPSLIRSGGTSGGRKMLKIHYGQHFFAFISCFGLVKIGKKPCCLLCRKKDQPLLFSAHCSLLLIFRAVIRTRPGHKTMIRLDFFSFQHRTKRKFYPRLIRKVSSDILKILLILFMILANFTGFKNCMHSSLESRFMDFLVQYPKSDFTSGT